MNASIGLRDQDSAASTGGRVILSGWNDQKLRAFGSTLRSVHEGFGLAVGSRPSSYGAPWSIQAAICAISASDSLAASCGM